MDEENTVHPDWDHPYLPGGESDSPCLKVYSGPLKGKAYPLTKEEYLIGRDPSSDIVVDEKVVSRRHARIVKKLNEYMISDLDSVNGIYINNLKLDKTVLQHGDMIQIGSCLFQYLWQRKRPGQLSKR
jgi:pSer/pThr/pTyr-binding forkhead associated (FHA) protein